MASKYTCTACMRILRSEARRYRSTDVTARFIQKNYAGQLRGFAGSTKSSAELRTEPRRKDPSANAPKKHRAVTGELPVPEAGGDSIRQQKLAKPVRLDPDSVNRASTDAQVEFPKFDPAKGVDFYRDEEGELHTPVSIPDDVRTYKWTSGEWTWGVLERLFQGCEQAKMRFEYEKWVDDEGRTKTRVVRDEHGQNKGIGEGWWFDVVGLPKTFNTWAVVCFLHMWILQVRIRHLPKPMSNHFTELLTNHCFWEAEKTMDLVQKLDGSSRKKYLKDYFEIWRGTILAYDEGLVKGDAVLAAAVWRMVFDAKEDVDPVKIAVVTAYIRREVARVGALGDKVLATGYVGFGEPVSETDVLMQSRFMKDSLGGS